MITTYKITVIITIDTTIMGEGIIRNTIIITTTTTTTIISIINSLWIFCPSSTKIVKIIPIATIIILRLTIYNNSNNLIVLIIIAII